MVKKVSIVIPVFNEQATIEKIFRRVISSTTPGYEKEIIIVDDGSNDRTKIILENLKLQFDFVFLNHHKNLGKGAAIRTALGVVTGEVVIIQDADLEYDPFDLLNLLSAFCQGFPIIYGSRNLARTERGYLLYLLGGKLLTIFFNTLFNTQLTDINTGYKLFRSDILKSLNLQSNGFEFCEEVTAKVIKSGYFIKEIPINYRPRTFAEGKKIRPKDGLIGMWTIIKHRFNSDK
jgi:glycosyltransferase involved in cell wall biosynthesis